MPGQVHVCAMLTQLHIGGCRAHLEQKFSADTYAPEPSHKSMPRVEKAQREVFGIESYIAMMSANDEPPNI